MANINFSTPQSKVATLADPNWVNKKADEEYTEICVDLSAAIISTVFGSDVRKWSVDDKLKQWAILETSEPIGLSAAYEGLKLLHLVATATRYCPESWVSALSMDRILNNTMRPIGLATLEDGSNG